MLADRYGLALSTASTAARDAYVEGYDLMFALWPGAADGFARATAEDPHFALAHLGSAQAAAATGDGPGAQASLAAAKATGGNLPEREASHLGFFALLLSGQADAARGAARAHLAAWPRDAAVMNHYGTILGLISSSGHSDVKREQEAVMDGFAAHYADDWWYMGHHAMAISERGRPQEARALVERSLAANPRNAFAAHSRGHVDYEEDAPGARAFLADWLPDYPRDGLAHGHLVWHLAIAELAAGHQEAALRLYHEALAPGMHQGAPRMRVYDAIQFLWRWELAGNPRDPTRWQAVQAFSRTVLPLPRSMNAFADLHVPLADAMAGNGDALQAWLEQMEELGRAGRYPGGMIVPDVARGLAAFARGDHAGAIAKLEPLLAETERLGGGSRAQHDLVEFTLLRAYVEAGRLDDMQRLLAARRPGSARVPVFGVH